MHKRIISKIKVFYFLISFIILHPIKVFRVFAFKKEQEVYHVMEMLCDYFLKLYKITLNIEGQVPNFNTNALYVANHQSMIDSVIMYKIARKPVSFFIAGEFEYMQKLPMSRVVLNTMDNVYVDRQNLRNGIESLKKGVSILATENQNLVIFPEGVIKHEQKNLNKPCGQFMGGSFRTAMKNNKPVVLVSINGSEDIHSDILMSAKINPGIVNVKIKHTFTSEEYQDMKPQDLADLCQQLVIEELTV